MVQLHRLWSLDGTNFWQQLSGKAVLGACPPSQSDCEELFSLLGLYQGIFMYVFI